MLDSECRACLDPCPSDVKYDDKDEHKWKLHFEICSGFSITDSEPQSLCLRCIEELRNCWRFKQRCAETQLRLEERVEDVVDAFQDEKFHCEECSYCGMTFEDSDELKNHLDAVHEKKPEVGETTKPEKSTFSCPHCETSKHRILSEIGLRKHFWRFHSEKKSERCPYCYQLQFPEFLNFHQTKCKRRPDRKPRKRVKSGEPTRVCPICGKMVKKTSLTTHIKSSHSEKECAAYVCDMCGHTSKTRGCILRHMREAHLGIHYRCELCPQTFRKFTALTVHRRKEHSDTYPQLQCKFCSYTTPISSNMYGHERTHLGEKGKRCRCEICGKTFFFIDRLKRHMRSHSDDRPFSCGTCLATFKTQKALNVHGQVHAQDKDYECPACLKPYATNQQMRLHVTKHHPDFQLPPPGTIMKKNIKRIPRTRSTFQ